MSWDVVLFNSRQEIQSVEEIDENQLEPTDFCSALEKHFVHIDRNESHREIQGEGFTIDYHTDDAPTVSKVLSLYGENALYELIDLACKLNWQIFDTSLGQMIDLRKPAINGYKNFHNYVEQIKGKIG